MSSSQDLGYYADVEHVGVTSEIGRRETSWEVIESDVIIHIAYFANREQIFHKKRVQKSCPEMAKMGSVSWRKMASKIMDNVQNKILV